MSAIEKTAPVITPVDRFTLTLCLAIIAHGVIILGVTFKPEDSIKPRYETMEIILVQQESEPVKDAEMLAQASLEGGGDTDEKVSPSTPVPAPFPDQKPQVTASPQTKSQPPAETTPPTPEPVEEEPVTEPKPVETIEQVAVEKEKADITTAETVEEVSEKPQPEKPETPTEPKPAEVTETKPREEQSETPPAPSAAALLTNSFEIASLSAEIKRKLEAKAKRPRRKFISASTREYKYAAYMEAWRAKVERVGNLNYPDAARRNRLTGSLILDVALNADGSVNEITIRRSSGSKILDDAAVRIVELSSPFAPFPEHIRQETDILHITRTWQFLNSNRFR
ncbi:MAG TPA: TonB family protein [Gammaproteobacteria bacterium]|nr:TonB family protein [Gammaproteobacteria bacterium]